MDEALKKKGPTERTPEQELLEKAGRQFDEMAQQAMKWRFQTIGKKWPDQELEHMISLPQKGDTKKILYVHYNNNTKEPFSLVVDKTIYDGTPDWGKIYTRIEKRNDGKFYKWTYSVGQSNKDKANFNNPSTYKELPAAEVLSFLTELNNEIKEAEEKDQIRNLQRQKTQEELHELREKQETQDELDKLKDRITPSKNTERTSPKQNPREKELLDKSLKEFNTLVQRLKKWKLVTVGQQKEYTLDTSSTGAIKSIITNNNSYRESPILIANINNLVLRIAKRVDGWIYLGAMETDAGSPLDHEKYTNPLNFTDITDTATAFLLLRRINDQITLIDQKEKNNTTKE